MNIIIILSHSFIEHPVYEIYQSIIAFKYDNVLNLRCLAYLQSNNLKINSTGIFFF